ncbi:MAG: GNAT family N-acetyltransferase [Bacteroidetes bacterium]|nr:GNAT family N-acetyltransferase [Bacteroidota bacterium]
MATEILTDRFILRSFVQSDLDDVYKGLSHPEVIKYYGISYKTLEETQAQIDWFKEMEVNHTGQWWAICNKDDAAFLGGVGFNNFQAKHFCAELGIWILPQHWGLGILKEVVNSVFLYAATEWKLHRMEAVVESDNRQCISGLMKAEFIFEGKRRECEYKDGRFIDLNIYSKLAK